VSNTLPFQPGKEMMSILFCKDNVQLSFIELYNQILLLRWCFLSMLEKLQVKFLRY